MKRWKRLGLLLAAGAIAGTSAGAAPAAAAAAVSCASGTPIKFAGITWKSGRFYTELIRTILETGYGCTTELVEGSTAETEAQLVAHRLHVWVEQWGGRTDVIKKGVASGQIKLVGDLLEGGSVEGWFVPEFVVKGDPRRGIKPLAPDLKSVSDLRKYKDLFKSSEEPGKGSFVNCPVGWDCERNNNQKLKAYGLTEDFVNHRPSSGAVLDMLIVGTLAVDKPLLFYYWSPAPLMGRFNLVKLQEPAYNEACWKTLFNSTAERPCGSETPPTKLSVGVATPFATSEPEIVKLIERVRLTPAQINRAIFRMTERPQSGAIEARYFLKNHPAVWQSWVPEPVALKVKAAVQ